MGKGCSYWRSGMVGEGGGTAWAPFLLFFVSSIDISSVYMCICPSAIFYILNTLSPFPLYSIDFYIFGQAPASAVRFLRESGACLSV